MWERLEEAWRSLPLVDRRPGPEWFTLEEAAEKFGLKTRNGARARLRKLETVGVVESQTGRRGRTNFYRLREK